LPLVIKGLSGLDISDGYRHTDRWDKCWIRLLDGMLQLSVAGTRDYELRIPTRIRSIVINNAAGTDDGQITVGDSLRQLSCECPCPGLIVSGHGHQGSPPFSIARPPCDSGERCLKSL
jgi:hypothetical protein